MLCYLQGKGSSPISQLSFKTLSIDLAPGIEPTTVSLLLVQSSALSTELLRAPGIEPTTVSLLLVQSSALPTELLRRGSNKKLQPSFKDFSKNTFDFQQPPIFHILQKNAHSESILTEI